MWLLNLNHWIVKKRQTKDPRGNKSAIHRANYLYPESSLHTQTQSVRKSQKSRENKDINRKFKTTNDQ